MSPALRMMLLISVIALVALVASRLTVRHVLVGNRTALIANGIETALDRYDSEHGHYPPLDFDLDSLAEARDGGPYFSAPPRDAWGHRFRYTLLNGKPKVYSAGPDGIFDTKDDVYAEGLTCKTRYVFW